MTGREGKFRDWLVARVMATRWSTAPIADEKLEAVAESLGVHPDVLLEARLNMHLERSERGLSPRVHQVQRTVKIKVSYPEEIKAIFADYCYSRGLSPSALLRSVLHAYLQGSYEPRLALHHAWIYKGKQYSFDTSHNYHHTTQLRVPHGAKRALELRARLLGTTAHAIMRALVLETLEEKFGHPGTLRIVDTLGMFDDETKYYLGDKR